MEHCRILCSDVDQHPVFFHFVDTIFHGARAETWTVWRDRGGWTGDYEVFAIVDDGRIVGTIGRSRMHMVIDGKDRVGYQLGAVATLEPYRRQGLARQLMDWVISELDEPDQPIILFANNSVLDFYPRFGFRRIPQRRSFGRNVLQPSGAQAPRCDLSNASDRSRLATLCAASRPTRGRLTARDYYWLALWNLSCGSATVSWVPEFEAAIATTIESERLVIHDVFAAQPFDLGLVLPMLITQPVMELEFLFDPGHFWATTSHADFDDTESALFARGAAASINGFAQFPVLAQT